MFLYVEKWQTKVKTHFFHQSRQYFAKFSFISINANTFALNLNKITMNELNMTIPKIS